MLNYKMSKGASDDQYFQAYTLKYMYDLFISYLLNRFISSSILSSKRIGHILFNQSLMHYCTF